MSGSGLTSNGYFEAVADRLRDPAMLSGLGARATSLVQKNIRDGNWTPNAPLTRAVKGGNPKPLMDEGHLVASITSRVESPRVIVWTNRPGANTVHDGGTIRATKSRFLTIPANRKAKQLMGSYGLTPRTCIEGMRQSGYNVFFRQAKGGQSGAVLYLPPNAKKNAVPNVLFVLKKEVIVPARPFMRLPEESLSILARYLLGYAARMED